MEVGAPGPGPNLGFGGGLPKKKRNPWDGYCSEREREREKRSLCCPWCASEVGRWEEWLWAKLGREERAL